tara:strand:+ start:559 stop:966 length:408 start_codon:yes stop_codon:yes gene_type:complete
MNPVLASSLVSVGKSFIEQLKTPSPTQYKMGNKTFSAELENVTSATQIKQSTNSLRKDLMQDPAIQSFLSKNAGNEIYFQKRADGSSQILSSSGDTITIGRDSPTNTLIHKYFDQCVLEGVCQSAHRPNTVLLKE